MSRSAVFIIASLALAGSVHAANPAMPVIPSTIFNVTNYGAMGDGLKDNTTNIQNTINAASAAGGGIVEIPAGIFLSGPITLYSSMNLRVDTNGMLQMLPLYTYPGGATNAQTFVGCNGVTDLEISGWGRIDGQGAAWWAYNATNNTIVRPMLLNLYNCNRLFIHDITFQNPANHHCGLRGNGGNITISNLTVFTTNNSPNTDGLNFVGTNSVIENCHISDGDDNIAMGSTGPIYDLLITNCTFGYGHGVSIGSGIGGITNLTVINCTFSNTGNGLRIKCARDNSLPIKNLNYLNLTMTNVNLPIVFYSYYDETGTPDHIPFSQVLAASNSLPVNGTTPIWRDITFSNIVINSPNNDIGGVIWGPTEMSVSNVTFIHVTNTAPKTFYLYNVHNVKVIDSKFTISNGRTFTLCNADVTISNSLPGSAGVTLAGAAATNGFALYNATASLTNVDAFGASPITLSGGTLTVSNNFSPGANTVCNFALGTNAATVVVKGNLVLNGTNNIIAGAGFTNGTYTLFTYTGTLSGISQLGQMPAGYNCILNTGTAGIVKLVATYNGVMPISTTNTIQSSANPVAYGTPVTFTATVNPAPTNGESVSFQDGATVLGSGAINAGAAAFTTTSNQLATGTHSITAVYYGDGAYGSSASDALTQTVNPASPPAGTLFSDTFVSSTVDSATLASPTATSTSYEVLSGKPWNPAPSVASGHLVFGIGGTSSGVIEVQALFKTFPFNLNAPGDFIQLAVTFTNTAGILSQSGFWNFGLFNSSFSAPVAGGLNNTLNNGTSTAATGGAQNWQGYFAQIGYTGNYCGFCDRKAQTGTANNNQDVVTVGTSSSCANPGPATIGPQSTAPSVALTVGTQYTEVLTYTLLTPFPYTLQLASQLYAGPDTNGTLLSTMTATTGTTPLATAFDALAFGWRATGSTPSQMTISSIIVTGHQTLVTAAAGPALSATLSGSTFTLTWPTNYLGWLLQSNSAGLASTNWSIVPGSDAATNFSITLDPGRSNVFYRLISQ